MTIGAAALIVEFAGNIQAIPITQHDFSASQAMRASDRGRQNLSPAGLTASISPWAVKVKPVRKHQKPGAGNLTLPMILPSGQGAYLLSGLNAPLLPAAPMRFPIPPIRVTSGGGTPVQNATGVPDGGMMVTMLGASFSGLALLRENLKS